MSKSSKQKTREKRRAQKRSQKEARAAQYLEWKLRGQNSKSKRARKQNQKTKGMKQRNHSEGFCGNVGCKRCYPLAYNLSTPTFLNL